MRRARWVLKPQDFPGELSRKPAIYHCISRVVERRFAFNTKGHSRYENERNSKGHSLYQEFTRYNTKGHSLYQKFTRQIF
jgi:hypothetical protein